MARNQGELQINSWQDLTDAGGFQEPVQTHLLDFVGDETPVKVCFGGVIVDHDFATRV